MARRPLLGLPQLLGWSARGAPRSPQPTRSPRKAEPYDRTLDTAPIDDYYRWVEGICKRMRLVKPFTPEDVLAKVEAYLGCELVLHVQDWEGATLYGACCPNGLRQYVIALRHDLTRRNRAKTIYHEVAHILRGHITATEPQFRSFEPSGQQDVEAEEIARIFLAWGAQGDYRTFIERFVEHMGGVG